MTDTADTRIEGEPLIKPSSVEHPLYDAVVEACRTVYDPEIPVNIFDLGLVYTIEINDQNEVDLIMTLTAPGCPVCGRHARLVGRSDRAGRRRQAGECRTDMGAALGHGNDV